jgi:hypothetical protein
MYLFIIGSVKNLHECMNIPTDYKNNNFVCRAYIIEDLEQISKLQKK